MVTSQAIIEYYTFSMSIYRPGYLEWTLLKFNSAWRILLTSVFRWLLSCWATRPTFIQWVSHKLSCNLDSSLVTELWRLSYSWNHHLLVTSRFRCPLVITMNMHIWNLHLFASHRHSRPLDPAFSQSSHWTCMSGIFICWLVTDIAFL